MSLAANKQQEYRLRVTGQSWQELRGRDMGFTRQVMSERLNWLHPQIAKSVRWDYFWMGELDMQRKTIPRLYGLGAGVVAPPRPTWLSHRRWRCATTAGGTTARPAVILSCLSSNRPESP